MDEIVTSNIRSFREFNGITQEELGDKLGVTRQTISAWEKGETTPNVAQLFRLAGELGVSTDLLFGVPDPETSLLFRSDDPSVLIPALKSLSTRRAGDYASVERTLGLVPTLPESRPLEGYEPAIVEEVAGDVRDWLGVDDAPLYDAISLLEEKGLKVLLQELRDQVSGFSAYTDEMGGVILVNATHPVERQAFTAFHELAHLIFHRLEYKKTLIKGSRDNPKEKAANHLAGAVLLPREALLREFRSYRGRWLPERLLADVKLRYRVSMRTIVIRASQVGLIAKTQAGCQIGMLDRKYGKQHEPVQLGKPEAKSRLERLVFAALVADLITTSRAAEIMGRPLPAVREELIQWAETPG